MNSRKTKLIIIACLCVAVLGLSIGYALLSTRLNITGTAKVPASTWDVVFLEDEIDTTETGMAKCNIGNIEGTNISGMSVEFTKPGDACTFSIPVENTGTISAKLVDVTGKSSNLTFVGSGKTALSDQELLKSNVVYEVNYGNTPINGTTDFSNIELLNATSKETVTLRVTFNHNAEDIPKNPVTLGGLDRGFIFESLTKEESAGQSGSSLDNMPNPPELNGNMIPVYYEATSETDGVWKKADINNENDNWYDYNEQKWANAVTIVSEKRNEIKNAAVGTPIDMNYINTMWVWIPRYSYTIKSEDGKNYYGKAGFGPGVPGEIDVKFISKVTETGTAQYTGDTPTNWRTNEAFDFDGEKKSGIWVGKFETTGTLLADGQSCINESCDVSKVTIKPDVSSLKNQTVSSFFYMARSMQVSYADTYGFNATSGDLHMIKNDEWGAVAYLSQSKYGKYGNSDYTGINKEIYINNHISKTGYSGGNPNASENDAKYVYNDMTNLETGQGQAGPGASTTGNIYGIYDMSGGAYEYVMGVLEYDEQGIYEHNGQIATGDSGFMGLDDNGSKAGSVELPNAKYYNKYKSANPTLGGWSSAKLETACNGGACYGHALLETTNWYNGYSLVINRTGPWFGRGGGNGNGVEASIFYVHNLIGNAINTHSCHLTLIP